MTAPDWRPAVTAAARLALGDAGVRCAVGLWLCDCLDRVLPVYEREHPGDHRVRQAIAVARRYAQGNVGDDARTAARSQAKAAEAGAREYALATAALVADALADQAINSAPWLAYQAVQIGAAQILHLSAEDAQAIEAGWQLQRLLDRLGSALYPQHPPRRPTGRGDGRKDRHPSRRCRRQSPGRAGAGTGYV